jgi:hypothetical protein
MSALAGLSNPGRTVTFLTDMPADKWLLSRILRTLYLTLDIVPSVSSRGSERNEGSQSGEPVN